MVSNNNDLLNKMMQKGQQQLISVTYVHFKSKLQIYLNPCSVMVGSKILFWPVAVSVFYVMLILSTTEHLWKMLDDTTSLTFPLCHFWQFKYPSTENTQ